MLMNKTTTQIILLADLEGIAERRDGESKKVGERGWEGGNED